MKFMEERGVSRWLLIVHVVLLLFLWWIPVQTFSTLPDQIAVHFDSTGQADRFAPKTGFQLWTIPFVGTVLGLGILILTLFPGLYDFPQKKEVKGWPMVMRLPVYAVIKEMLLTVLLCLDVVWLFAEYSMVASAREAHAIINWTGILIPALAPIGLLVYYLNKLSRVFEEAKAKVSL